MKSTAITRQIDELGRIVLPVELRRNLKISKRDSLEIYVEDDKIILKKFNQSCVFCGNEDNVLEFKDKFICPDCLSQLKK
ncbi:MAG: AbrB/MazE/SpoVT family DNA-binding domain-containing protein [Huintestinicola sp.]